MKYISSIIFLFLSIAYSNPTLANDHVLITKDNTPYLYESHSPKASISSLLSISERPKDEFERKKRLPVIHKQLEKYEQIQKVKYSLVLKLGKYNFKQNNFKLPLTQGDQIKSVSLMDIDLLSKINPVYLGTDYFIRFNINSFSLPMSEEAASTYIKTNDRLIKVELLGTINNTHQNSSKKSVPNFFGSGSTAGYEISKTLSMQVNRIIIKDMNGAQILDEVIKK